MTPKQSSHLAAVLQDEYHHALAAAYPHPLGEAGEESSFVDRSFNLARRLSHYEGLRYKLSDMLDEYEKYGLDDPDLDDILDAQTRTLDLIQS